MSIKITNKQRWFFSPTEIIETEISDTDKGFYVRMVCLTQKAETKWSAHYEGVLILTLPSGEKFGYASAYWEGFNETSLPTEQPFRISLGVKQ